MLGQCATTKPITIRHTRAESTARTEDITIGAECPTSIGQKDSLTVGQRPRSQWGKRVP